MIQPGIKGSAELRVDASVTAKTIGSGTLEVLATPAMVALMEKAAWTSVAEHLAPGYGTVGTMLQITHVRPTPLGKIVTSSSELIEVDGRRLVFHLSASDEQGLIGEGTHERFIIENEKFMAKANR